MPQAGVYSGAEADAAIAAHAELPTVHQNAPQLIAAHALLATAHQDAPQLIAAHALLATVHQNAPQLIAAHALLATVHQNAPQLISDHAGVATAHQDAPTLISDHAGISGAHHTPAIVPILAITGDMQANAATGDAVNPQYINDGLIDNACQFANLNEYAQTIFQDAVQIGQFRFYETEAPAHNGDGELKIQYLSLQNVWTDWKTGIVIGLTGTWQSWDDTPSSVTARGIKVICTKLDTGTPPAVYVMELEVKA